MPFALTASFFPLQFAETYVLYTPWFHPEDYILRLIQLLGKHNRTTKRTATNPSQHFSTSQATIAGTAGSILSVLDGCYRHPNAISPATE